MNRLFIMKLILKKQKIIQYNRLDKFLIKKKQKMKNSKGI